MELLNLITGKTSVRPNRKPCGTVDAIWSALFFTLPSLFPQIFFFFNLWVNCRFWPFHYGYELKKGILKPRFFLVCLIYISLAALALSCGTWDPRSYL